jgi:hypothetical protein
MLERNRFGNIEFIGVKTKSRLTGEERGVTLAPADGGCVLLGNIEHATVIVIDQELVDNLQTYLNEMENHVG